MGKKKKKKSGGAGTLSLNIFKGIITVGGTALLLKGTGIIPDDWADKLSIPMQNLREHWKEIVLPAVGVTILGRILGKYAPRVGVKKTASIKLF